MQKSWIFNSFFNSCLIPQNCITITRIWVKSFMSRWRANSSLNSYRWKLTPVWLFSYCQLIPYVLNLDMYTIMQRCQIDISRSLLKTMPALLILMFWLKFIVFRSKIDLNEGIFKSTKWEAGGVGRLHPVNCVCTWGEIKRIGFPTKFLQTKGGNTWTAF